ncbi:MAG: DUF2513 domain-containing protein [Bryobacteraceae bacterium]|jgi:hypothetical protein
MIVYPVKEESVRRDMDLIREILRQVEANPKMDGRTEVVYQSPEEMGISGHSLEELAYHAKLLIKGGYLEGNLCSGYTMPSISSLTNAGHDFLGSITEPGIWEKTKAEFSGLPGVALRVIEAFAEAELKKHLGL